MSQKPVFEPVIGIESHVQLLTKSKLFCGCSNDARGALPNTLICPICLGLPGSLPYLNKEAVRLTIRAGLALAGKIAEKSKFDRKNYFYPDLPKGYQITQFSDPLVSGGQLTVRVPEENSSIAVGIVRIHLEEDAGKLTHPTGADYSLVDLNRAGTPLIEIVSQPDLRSPAQAKAFAQELYRVVRYGSISDADLFHGNMRFDLNVSIRAKGEKKLGTRTEIKNLNSFRSLERAAKYEIERQIGVLSQGKLVIQDTMGWDEQKQKTFSQRSKEESHDYRYFPEPDLPPLVITSQMILHAGENLQTVQQVREKLLSAGISDSDTEALISQPALTAVFLKIAESVDSRYLKRIASWLLTEVTKLQQLQPELPLEPEFFNELAELVDAGHLSQTAAKQVLSAGLKSGKSPKITAMDLNLLQVSDADSLHQLAGEIVLQNPAAVKDFHAGKPQAIGFMVGQLMKLSQGKANPALAREILTEQLKNKEE